MFDPLQYTRTAFVLVIMLCMPAAPALAQTEWEEKTAVQALIGASHFDSLILDVPHSLDSSVTAGTEYTWMPLIGIAGQLPFRQTDTYAAGLEGSVIAGWRSKSVTVIGNNGTLSVYVDNSLLLLDLSMGLFLSTELGSAARVYIGAGPLLMFGINDNDTREVATDGSTRERNHESSSAFGAGLYGRGGIEFRLADRSLMGVGVRAFSTRMDFDNVDDETSVRGIQFMITYTVGI